MVVVQCDAPVPAHNGTGPTVVRVRSSAARLSVSEMEVLGPGTSEKRLVRAIQAGSAAPSYTSGCASDGQQYVCVTRSTTAPAHPGMPYTGTYTSRGQGICSLEGTTSARPWATCAPRAYVSRRR